MIPKSYDECTVEQFMFIHEVLESKEESTPKLINYFTGKDPDSIPFSEYEVYSFLIKNLIASRPSEKIVEKVEVNGKRYDSVTDVTKFSTNQGTALETYNQLGKYKNLHFICSLCFYPEGKEWDSENQQEIAKDFLKAKIGSVWGTVFFYSKVWERLNPVLILFLEEANQTIKEHLKEMSQDKEFLQTLGISSGEIMAGITL
jgi:hypothetical protein